MKILVISDYFYQQTSISMDELEYIKWNEYKLLSLRGYDSIVIDMTFESKEINPNKTKLLYELKTNLEKPNFISKNNLILIVICGSPKEEFEFEEAYDQDATDKVYYPKNFSSYDFMKAYILEYMGRIDFEEGKHVYCIRTTLPVSLYLNNYKTGPTFLSYDYDPDSEKCVDVTPLAKVKETGNACVAFEYKSGKGLSVILPSYAVKDKERAFSLLLSICRSYFKIREGIKELIEVEDAIPEPVKETFIEAISCFNYNLYTASLLMCRRSLEESAIHQGASDKNFLRKKIEELHSKSIIDSNMKEVAIEITEFGNWSAHPGKYMNKKITEEDVIYVIEFLKIYFDYVYCIPEKLKQSTKRRQVLEGKEVG